MRCPGEAPSLFVGAVLHTHRLPSQSVACKSASPPADKRERSNNIERVEPRRDRPAASLAALARPGWTRWGRWGERLEAMTGPPRVRACLRPLCVLGLVRLFLHLHRFRVPGCPPPKPALVAISRYDNSGPGSARPMGTWEPGNLGPLPPRASFACIRYLEARPSPESSCAASPRGQPAANPQSVTNLKPLVLRLEALLEISAISWVPRAADHHSTLASHLPNLRTPLALHTVPAS